MVLSYLHQGTQQVLYVMKLRKEKLLILIDIIQVLLPLNCLLHKIPSLIYHAELLKSNEFCSSLALSGGNFLSSKNKKKTSLKNFLEKFFSDISGTTRKALKTSFFYFKKWKFLMPNLKTFSFFHKKNSISNFLHQNFLHHNLLYHNHQKKFLCLQ